MALTEYNRRRQKGVRSENETNFSGKSGLFLKSQQHHLCSCTLQHAIGQCTLSIRMHAIASHSCFSRRETRKKGFFSSTTNCHIKELNSPCVDLLRYAACYSFHIPLPALLHVPNNNKIAVAMGHVDGICVTFERIGHRDTYYGYDYNLSPSIVFTGNTRQNTVAFVVIFFLLYLQRLLSLLLHIRCLFLAHINRIFFEFVSNRE